MCTVGSPQSRSCERDNTSRAVFAAASRHLPSAMNILKRVAAGLALILAACVMWGLIEPYFIDIEDFDVAIPNLPEAWEGRRFAQLSDWQLGMWMDNETTVRHSVERLVETRPDFVLISGDFVYHAGDDPQPVIRRAVDLARPLPEAGIPTFAVLGNHDYAMRKKDGTPDEELAGRIERALEEAGIVVLQNESHPLPAATSDDSGEDLYIIGIGANWPGKDDPESALSDVPDSAARIVVMHNPNTLEALPAHSAPLAVAGHTHGGQIRLPFSPNWSYLTFVKADAVHVDGWIESERAQPGNRLYVNRGIGFSTLPLRINCMPEITVFNLTPMKAGGDEDT